MAYRIATDIHTHTLFSRHAYSTIEENVRAARAAGLDLLGSTDHLSDMLYPQQELRHFQHFTNKDGWPRVWMGVTLLRGAEVDIVSTAGAFFGQDIEVTRNIAGGIFKTPRSLFTQVTRNLDYLVASVHNRDFCRDATQAQATQMYLNALENPKVFVLGHVGRSGVRFDVDEVLLRARALGKLIEINNNSLKPGGSWDSCRHIAERCAELGVGITVSSDAHISAKVGRYPHAATLLDEVHFPQELIKNRDRDTLLEALAKAGVCDLREEVATALAEEQEA